MLTVTDKFEADYREKGSKFLAFITPCDTTEQADQELSFIREQHPSATHHCYAYRIHQDGILEHSQDDGEPGGTAGLPILNAMRSADIVHAMIVVVRYYGGTKLGKSGLITAYGASASLAIETAELKKMVKTRRFRISYAYNQQSLIDRLKHSHTLFEIDASYTANVDLTIECPAEATISFEKDLQSVSHLLMEIEKLGVHLRVLA